ncbi:autotransporter-associated beta strand repeat-containing protein [Rariglobus hedericola]|nr:autotransporter-associated beta strand repeat-containing protein [Rariglobus hedericola]
MKNHYRTPVRRGLALGSILLASLVTLEAATPVWDGGSSGTNRGWDTASNWNPNTAIATGDDVSIGTGALGGSATAIGGMMGINASYTIRSLTLDNTSGLFPTGGLFIRNSTLSTPTSNTLTFNTAAIDAIKFQGGSSPTVTFISNTSTANLTINLGYTGQANFSVAGGGTLTFDGSNNAAAMLTGTGGINKTGAGTLVLSGVSNDFAGGLTISGGTVEFDSATRLGSVAIANTDAIVIANGTLRLTASSGSFNNSANRGIRVGDQSSVIDVKNSGVDLSLQNSVRNISGQNGVLTKAGLGNLSLEGNTYSYTGGTLVNAGTLTVNGVTVGGSSSVAGITVASGATLRGSGTFNGNSTFAAGSTVNVGTYAANAQTAAIGAMTFNDGLTINGGTFLIDLAAPGSSDLIASSSLNISNGVFDLSNLVFTTVTGYSAGTYTLFSSSSSVVGSFGSNVTGTLGGLNVVLAFGNAGTTIDLIVTSSAIPEPSTFAGLSGLVALGCASLRRRRQSA